MKSTVRTFIAIETSDAVRQQAAELIGIFAATGAKVSWVKPHHLHLTLKFLDEVPLTSIPQVSAAVQEAVAVCPPFELEICTAARLSKCRPAADVVARNGPWERTVEQSPCGPGKRAEAHRLSQGASPLRRAPDDRPGLRPRSGTG